jgi:hypothetical protein
MIDINKLKAELSELEPQTVKYKGLPLEPISRANKKKLTADQKDLVKERKVLIERMSTLNRQIRFLEYPNAQTSLNGMKTELEKKVKIINDRWEQNKDTYKVAGISKDEPDKLKAHHHELYGYKKLIKSLAEVNFLLQ